MQKIEGGCTLVPKQVFVASFNHPSSWRVPSTPPHPTAFLLLASGALPSVGPSPIADPPPQAPMHWLGFRCLVVAGPAKHQEPRPLLSSPRCDQKSLYGW